MFGEELIHGRVDGAAGEVSAPETGAGRIRISGLACQGHVAGPSFIGLTSEVVSARRASFGCTRRKVRRVGPDAALMSTSHTPRDWIAARSSRTDPRYNERS